MSPSGFEAFQRHADTISARRSGGGEYQPINYFSLKDGETARVRFLEQGTELTWAISHRIKSPGLQYPSDVLCLDQEDDGVSCPACQSDNKEIRSRSTKGYVNLIWRGTEDEGYSRAPIYKLNDKGFAEKVNNQKVITGYEDNVFLWKCSKTVFELILLKDPKYKGIMSRDFVISRKGAGLENTTYAMEPAVIDGGGPEGMSVADASLAQKKFDVVSLTTPGTYDEMVSLLSGQQNAQSNISSPESREDVFNNQGAVRSSAFSR